ncbi:MAG: DNA-deoxyinosine glycosylase [Casimicrobiaceae bacterium]
MATQLLTTPAPRLRGLPPVLAPHTRVLVLGSFPGVASLAARAYYAHPRNHFWPIMAAVLDEPLMAMAYAERLDRLRARRVGLWDTIVACARPGSLDVAIRDATFATPAQVARRAPAVGLVCFNGKTAARAAPAWGAAGYATLALPSTSPAYTRPLAEKLAQWRAIADHLAKD